MTKLDQAMQTSYFRQARVSVNPSYELLQTMIEYHGAAAVLDLGHYVPGEAFYQKLLKEARQERGGAAWDSTARTKRVHQGIQPANQTGTYA